MKRIYTLLMVMAMAIGLSVQSHATTLTFDGDICTVGPCSHTYWYSPLIHSTYGDIPGQLNVSYASRTSTGNGSLGVPYLTWNEGPWGGLYNVATSPSYKVAEIALFPAPGFQVILNSFDLGTWSFFTSMGTQYRLYDSSYTLLADSGAITVSGSAPSHFNFALTNAAGLIIQWGPNGGSYAGHTSNYVAIDNLNFTVEQIAAPVPEPATLLLLGSGLAGIGGAAWRRKKKVVPSDHIDA